MWNLLMITWRLTVTNGQKSQICCRLLQTYCHLHSHVILTIQPEKARKFRNSSTNGDLVAAGRHFTCNTSILLHRNTIRIQPVEFWIAKRSVAVALISEYVLRLIAGCWKSECISIIFKPSPFSLRVIAVNPSKMVVVWGPVVSYQKTFSVTLL